MQRFVADLERSGILVRLSTGGLRSDGARATNRYTLFHNRLREALGLESRWESKYDGNATDRMVKPSSCLNGGYNAYFNYERFAHFSESARQRRRFQQRWREGPRRKTSRTSCGRSPRFR